VAHVAEITAADPRKDPADRARIPAYYLADGRVADFWFRLWDIRRLVQDDTESVIHALQQLRNVRYEGKPVSIYGGMVELPLIAGRLRGQTPTPLYPGAPSLAATAADLYGLLALVDALRIGRARERALATSQLRERLAP
jgi:hypothetical protein